MGMTLKSFSDTIARRLGRSGRAVELEAEDYTQAISTALRRLAEVRPEYGYKVIPVSTTVGKYVIDVKNPLGVLECTFFNNGGKFAYYPYPDQSIDHMIIQGQLKEQELIFQDLPEWESFLDTDPADSDKEKLYIMLHFNSDSFVDRAGRIPTHIAVKYTWFIEASDDPKVGLPRLRNDLQAWTIDYATAQARLVLAEIRGKYEGIPGPGEGETLGIDGNRQWERATADIERLETELRSKARQLPMIFD